MTKKDTTTLAVVTREKTGRDARLLRRMNLIPSNIMGLGKTSEAISVLETDFSKHLEEEGESGLLYLRLDDEKKTTPVLIEDIQFAPVSGATIHVVFRRVNLLEKVTANIELEIIGEFLLKNANLVVVTDTLEVEALPADLPENFTLDASKLTEVGQVFTIADLEYDRDKVTILMSEEEKDNPLVMAQEQREEEVGVVVPVAEADPVSNQEQNSEETEGSASKSKE
jgi:large subunit ribosomal protein L25